MAKRNTKAIKNDVNTGTKFKPQLAATALVEAAYLGDEKAAEHWGITVRTLYNWRERLNEDHELAAIFNHKRELFEAGWRDDIGLALRAGLDFLRRAALEANTKDHEVIYSVAGAVKIMADVRATMDVLDARLADFNRESAEADRALAAGNTEAHGGQ